MSFESTPSSFSKAVVETTLLVNSANPTIVGTWDLNIPSTKEAASTRIRTAGHKKLETLGPEGDRRTKVLDITEPKEYRAICKLFMSYKDGGSDEFIGTGWLVGTDIIATAGHCLYDSVYNGGYLRYIKCYFGYSGPSSVGSPGCVYRWGTAAAVPAEYLKSPSSEVHDVGFIRLNDAVPGIDPVIYDPTPALAETRLGVVGYPGDVDFGHNMYEHWANVQIDLAKSGNLLSYKVDTTPGNSGSPVFRKLGGGKLHAVGVHVAGGFPNTGSAIGPMGNSFEEYILALNAKKGLKTNSATIVPVAGPSILAPGFQLIEVKASTSLSESSKIPQNRPIPPQGIHTPESTTSLTESMLALDKILEFGQGKGHKKTSGVRKPAKATGTFLQYPEFLVVPQQEADLPAPNYDKAVADAMSQDDIKTIFFVNFPLELEGEALVAQQNLQKSVQSWQAWSSTLCEGKVQQKIDAKALPSDSKGEFARSTYRAKVFDYLFRHSTWFAKSFEQATTKHIEAKKAEFHSEILSKVLEGFSIPTSVFSALEKLLSEISSGISLSTSSESEAQQYWIMLTKYNYLSVSKTVQTTVRVIQFQVTQDARKYTTNKASYESIAFDLQFSQYQADFNNDIYAEIRKKIDQKLIDAGTELVENNSFDVDI